jgi:hypothetical protein
MYVTCILCECGCQRILWMVLYAQIIICDTTYNIFSSCMEYLHQYITITLKVQNNTS